MASPGPLRAGLKKALSPHNAAPPAKLAKLEPSSKASLGLGTLDSSDDDCSWGPSQPAEAATGAGPLTQLAAAGSGQVSRAFCPHCSCYLPDVGGGSAGAGAAHVAACGQGAGQAAEEAGEDSEGNWSEAEEEGVGAEGLEEGGDPAEGPSAEEEGLLEEEEGEPEEAEPQEQQQSEVGAWLASHGLERFAPNFERAGADLSLLPYLTEGHLQEMGLATLGARRSVMLAAEQLRESRAPQEEGPDERAEEQQEQQAAGQGRGQGGAQPSGSGGGATSEEQQQQEQAAAAAAAKRAHRVWERGDAVALATTTGIGSWRALASGTSASIKNFYRPLPGQRAQQAAAGEAGGGEAEGGPPGEGILRFFQPQGGGRVAPAVGKAPAAGAKAKPWVHGGASTGGRRWGGGGRAAVPQPMRPWQLVAGTQFVVDRFCNLPATTPTHRHWFLTHFHADHYKGLSGRFDRGTIYCSPPTAALVRQQLRVAPARIVEIPLLTPTVVDGVRVTFLDANHCPGAVMILFEPPGRRPVLHSGDCRLTAAMQAEPALAAVRGGVDLVLDTTYCAPEYTFPSQEEVLQFSIDAVRAESFNPRTLFLFGSYTIGKERLFLEAARTLDRKIYVSAAKRKVLDCLELGEAYRRLLTTDDCETNMHAVPLWMVTHKHMAQLLRHYRGRFTSAVGFQPTGWTHQKEAGAAKARGRRRQRGSIITYQVPYSEHSSFTELRQFVAWLQPLSITPSVNSDGGGPKARALVALLRPGGGG